ncbi:MAG: amino acid ABC transporter permease [Candidatus Limnocylindrales bacterium]|jgi:polar amino acid transport system permease protein
MSALRNRGIRPALLVGCLFLLALSVAGCSSGKAQSFNFKPDIFLQDLNPTSQGVLGALYVTIVISVVAQALGVALGVLAALGKMARILPFRVIANVYIWFFRGTPLLVQLVFFYFGFGAAHIWGWDDITIFGFFIPGALQAAMVILGVNEGAYMAEIIRAGILAVDPGQTEAAKSLGMTYRLTMTRIVLPQAARVIIPPLGNEFNNMLKTTSLIFVLGVVETYNHYVILQGLNYRPFEAYAACALWFLLLTTIWGFIQSRIELRFARGTATGSSAAQGPGWRARIFGGGPQVDEIGALGGH